MDAIDGGSAPHSQEERHDLSPHPAANPAAAPYHRRSACRRALLPRPGLPRQARRIVAEIGMHPIEALIGQGCQRGYDLAAAMLRDMGMPIELMSADTESKPEVARTQAQAHP